MFKRTAATMFFAVMFLFCFTACRTTTHRDLLVGGNTFGKIESLNDYAVDISLDSKKITGRAERSRILWFASPANEDYASGYVLDRDGRLTPCPGPSNHSSLLEQTRAAAVRNACDSADCDILAFPLFKMTEERGFLSMKYIVEVKGFPGTINGVENVKRTILPGEVKFGPKPEDEIPYENRYRFESETPINVEVNRK